MENSLIKMCSKSIEKLYFFVTKNPAGDDLLAGFVKQLSDVIC